jgi:hypothetical protein
MSDTNRIERRRQRRLTVDFNVLLVVPGAPVRECRVVNANVYGCCLLLGDEGLPPAFHLVDRTEGNVVRAEVRWWRDDHAGLVFTEGWWLATNAPAWIRETMKAYAEEVAARAA